MTEYEYIEQQKEVENQLLYQIFVDNYERGREEVWECIKKVINNLMDENEKIFGKHMLSLADIVSNFTASEFMAKLKEYEDKNVIHVGDEVTNGCVTFVVSNIFDQGYEGIRSDGSLYTFFGQCSKTGRSFPQVAELLKKISRE